MVLVCTLLDHAFAFIAFSAGLVLLAIAVFVFWLVYRLVKYLSPQRRSK